MATIEQSIAEIKPLLERFNGVTVRRITRPEARVIFELGIIDAASILWMEDVALGANIGGKMAALGAPGKGESMSESLGKLVFPYSIPTDGEKLEWYGCHLVWNLAARELLELPEADRLMTLWGGRPRW